ncbi:MAG TPA: phospholipase D family protein [Alphaproteobacteria bacterium]|nr:phospholipase D family protein [Alphaproteobacteria bacterium]
MIEKRKPIKRKTFKVFSFSKFSPSALLAFFIGCGVGFSLYPTLNEGWVASSTEKAHINVCFSPEGQCTIGIVSAIEDAKTSIFVMAYSFTSLQIAQALVDAFERGVDVKVLIDKSQIRNKYSHLQFFSKSGIPVFIDPAKGIAHNKAMILDDRFVLTGSFNWSKAANSKNAENILLIDDPSLAQIYKENWKKRAMFVKRHSLPELGRK